jgi:hypothetical protein
MSSGLMRRLDDTIDSFGELPPPSSVLVVLLGLHLEAERGVNVWLA